MRGREAARVANTAPDSMLHKAAKNGGTLLCLQSRTVPYALTHGQSVCQKVPVNRGYQPGYTPGQSLIQFEQELPPGDERDANAERARHIVQRQPQCGWRQLWCTESGRSKHKRH